MRKLTGVEVGDKINRMKEKLPNPEDSGKSPEFKVQVDTDSWEFKERVNQWIEYEKAAIADFNEYAKKHGTKSEPKKIPSEDELIRKGEEWVREEIEDKTLNDEREAIKGMINRYIGRVPSGGVILNETYKKLIPTVNNFLQEKERIREEREDVMIESVGQKAGESPEQFNQRRAKRYIDDLILEIQSEKQKEISKASAEKAVKQEAKHIELEGLTPSEVMEIAKRRIEKKKRAEE